jgi:drug/metabolite transporter (DMT)-like permease
VKNIVAGVLFAVLWSSASVATKFAVLSASPLITANIRFFIAGILLLSCSYILFKNDSSFRLPDRGEWKQLAVFGLLNTTVYLGQLSVAENRFAFFRMGIYFPGMKWKPEAILKKKLPTYYCSVTF